MHFKTQLLNMAFYVLTALLLFGIVKYVRAALMLQTAFFMVVGLANYYVLNFRSAPIMPWDIYSISTAASVAGNFNYELSTSTILVIVGFLILLLMTLLTRIWTIGPQGVSRQTTEYRCRCAQSTIAC